MNVKKIFGERIRYLRKKGNLNQKELAELLGLTENAIGMMERGNRGTTIEKLVLLSKYFQISTDYLLGLTDGPTGCDEAFGEKEGQNL